MPEAVLPILLIILPGNKTSARQTFKKVKNHRFSFNNKNLIIAYE